MPEIKKIRAVLLKLTTALYMFDDDDNGPEWFKDPVRNILILRYFDTPVYVRTRGKELELPSDRVIWEPRDLVRFATHPLTEKGERPAPLDQEEILFVTDDASKNFVCPPDHHGWGSAIPVLRVPDRHIVTIDRIIGEIYRVEHERQRISNEH